MEEKGQSSVEYIMLIGGIFIATLIIVIAYKRMTSTTGSSIEQGINTTTNSVNSTMSKETSKI